MSRHEMTPNEYGERHNGLGGPDDPAITRVLEAGAPPMRFDLAGIEAAGQTRVRRRRLAYGALGATAVAAVAAASLTFGPLRAAPPNLTPATSGPVPTATGTSAVTSAPAVLGAPTQKTDTVYDAGGRDCGALPIETRRSLDPIPQLGAPRMSLTAVRGATGTTVASAAEDAALEARLSLVDAGTRAVIAPIQDLGRERVVTGVWDGRLAAYSVRPGQRLEGYDEVWLYDAATNRRTLIDSLDSAGWGPASGPVLVENSSGALSVVWSEWQDRGGPVADAPRRLVSYDPATQVLTVLAEGSWRPIGSSASVVWLGLPRPGSPDWVMRAWDGRRPDRGIYEPWPGADGYPVRISSGAASATGSDLWFLSGDVLYRSGPHSPEPLTTARFATGMERAVRSNTETVVVDELSTSAAARTGTAGSGRITLIDTRTMASVNLSGVKITGLNRSHLFLGRGDDKSGGGLPVAVDPVLDALRWACRR